MNSLVPIVEAQSLPLADYFFICGLEPARLFDSSNGSTTNGGTAPGSPFNGDKIDEDGPYNADSDQRPGSSNGTSEAGRRRARFSYEARKSITSVLDLESQIPASSRSSTTIRAVAPETETPMDEQGFMKALQSFTTEREAFLGDINAATLFSAGQGPPPAKPRPKAKTQRIVGDERRDVGTMRRRLSTMNPLSRQSTTSKRRKSGHPSLMLPYTPPLEANAMQSPHDNRGGSVATMLSRPAHRDSSHLPLSIP